MELQRLLQLIDAQDFRSDCNYPNVNATAFVEAQINEYCRAPVYTKQAMVEAFSYENVELFVKDLAFALKGCYIKSIQVSYGLSERHVKLAHSLLVFENNDKELAFASYKRVMQNNCSMRDFEKLLNDGDAVPDYEMPQQLSERALRWIDELEYLECVNQFGTAQDNYCESKISIVVALTEELTEKQQEMDVRKKCGDTFSALVYKRADKVFFKPVVTEFGQNIIQ
ncbi:MULTISPECIES: hypothetical protein [Vibrio harveyi group]|uniref:Uncharacterized protein n=1 Tax=Vibrio jasicida TaxID=766224 RepID=A0AAU9QTQ9_9VIBR|nr:hypothetical protein [Vibrio alginolyticus]MCZ2798983.1 hypothetical protein [Vibrio alginolyticus]CAH1588822.1 conserved hypothetical protein [Vibrio jasicida]CAH1599750.1 conserved hypothetical protein [Vibrio jasicida]